MNNPGEYVFINGGQIYKQDVYFSGASRDRTAFNYIPNQTEDPVAPIGHVKSEGTKIYETTKEVRAWFGIDSGESLSGYDLCPYVTLWYGKGYFTNDVTDYDLYFRIDNSTQLQNIATYYNLPYPISSDLTTILDNEYSKLSMYFNGTDHIVLGGIKFIDNTPSLLKMYCVIKQSGNKGQSQKAKVYANLGNVVEEGYKSDVVKTNIRTFKKKIKLDDPFAQWEAVINDTGEIEQYESSKAIRKALAHLTTGNDFSNFDLCPSVNLWLARSWVGATETLYFYLESAAMLEAVATYYRLNEPCDAAMKAKIDSNPEAFRLRHHDIYGLGKGNWVPIVVAAIVFDNKTAITFKLIEITRWNE